MKYIAITSLLLASGVANASIWIDATNLHLRHHIQRLSDANIIKSPVTTYPLMWNSINDDITRVKLEKLPENLRNSYMQVMHYYKKSKANKFGNQLKLSAANNPKRLSGFGDSYREKAKLTLSKEVLGDFWAAKLSTQLRHDPEGGQKLTFDDSYAAVIYGNWILKAGATPQWWGPGWSSSLLMTNNARPLPALSLTRSNSKAFETPLLSWIGRWSFTAQMAKLESNRTVPDALLWSTRAVIRPFDSLELGANWSIQWGGKGQPSSLSDFWSAIRSSPQCSNGASTCDSAFHTKYGNQLAGIDLRWHNSIFNVPFSFYAQTVGEDAVGYKPVDKAYVYGIDSSAFFNGTRLYLEYTDTQVGCGESSSTTLNCYYEHSTYKTGYRYHKRAIGTTFDNDAKAWSLGAIGETEDHHQWHMKLIIADLNSDNVDRHSVPALGNQVSKVHEELKQIEFEYKVPVNKGLFTVGIQGEHSTFRTQDNQTEFTIYSSWDIRY